MKVEQSQLVSVNLARALAALSVFVFHYQVGFILSKFSGISQLQWIAIPGGAYGVDLFFVISGFCIHGSEWRRMEGQTDRKFDLLRYFERRFRRIYPIYLFALVFACFVNTVDGTVPNATDVFIHALVLQGFSVKYFNTINLVLWTITIEGCFYLVYPLWLAFRVKFGLAAAFLLGTMVSWLACICSSAFFNTNEFPVRWFFLNTWGGWLFGALLAETIKSSPYFYQGPYWWTSGAILWTVGMIAELRGWYAGHYLIWQFPVRIYLCAWVLSALVIRERFFTVSKGPLALALRLLSAIGLSSYSLYLLHEPLITLRNMLQYYLPSGVMRQLFQIIWFFIILALSWLSYLFVELKFLKSSPKPGFAKVA